ncbi:MAG TPA: MarR family transcriptional regulator [Candidatus Gallacutalibacter pullicola]|uniref:MarR family transcriptional regulator n=1 Tax=Candidatus Gallacutalibacter pullicola TaxID=2840830 RepID=A0A9D1J2C7_9FIRM|nr:MarR family transcriptional regulator [Candidatus Gallacutalibacter pullicola]
MTDYRALAEKMIELSAQLHLFPPIQQLAVFEKGTFLALHYLSAPPKMIHPKELSQKMAVSSARVAALLNHMEQEGLIVRTPDPGDSRQTIVSLTSRGEELMESTQSKAREQLAEVLESLGPEDAETFVRIQSKILQNVATLKFTAAKSGL